MTPAASDRPLVSFVIPAYKCARYLPDAIESALAQTWPRVEIVVVNDGSPDETDEVIEPYVEQIVYRKQANRGLSAARNEGFRKSKGDYICFLDADDTVLPSKIETQLAAFSREPDLGVVLSGYTFVEDDGKTQILEVMKPWNRDAMARLLAHESFAPHAALIKRSVLEASSLFPENIDTYESQEDWQLWLELALGGVQFGSVAESTCLYRQRSGSIRQDPVRHNEGARRVVRWLRSKGLPPEVEKAINRLEDIVEMERVAAHLRMGRNIEARTLLAERVAQHDKYWQEPSVWLRLFERSLSVWEEGRWRGERNPAWYRTVVLDGLLGVAGCATGYTVPRSAMAAAWLALTDLQYGQGDALGARTTVREVLRMWPRAALESRMRASLLRGVLGPALGGALRRWLRHLDGDQSRERVRQE